MCGGSAPDEVGIVHKHGGTLAQLLLQFGDVPFAAHHAAALPPVSTVLRPICTATLRFNLQSKNPSA